MVTICSPIAVVAIPFHQPSSVKSQNVTKPQTQISISWLLSVFCLLNENSHFYIGPGISKMLNGSEY